MTDYTKQLEELIAIKLLPIYSKYYLLIGEPEPDLQLPVPLKKQQVPALLSGAFAFTSNRQTARKN